MIHIITPCSRPENLRAIYETIPAPCRWAIILDASAANRPEIPRFRSFLDLVGCDNHAFGRPVVVIKNCWWTGLYGNPCRNQALDEMWAGDDDWVYFLDDDNLIHPEWYGGVLPHLRSDATMLGWGQLNRDGSVRLPPPAEVRLNHIDTAMFMVRWRALKNVRFLSQQRDADGRLAVDVASRHGHRTIDRPLCWYNALR